MLNARELRRRLLDQASAPYRAAGRFAWHFARGKLGGDPVFVALLERGLLPAGARVLDLGCGQGLLATWLSAAVRLHAAGEWCQAWPAPPAVGSYRGIELMDRDVARAQSALQALTGSTGGSPLQVVAGDIRTADFATADVVVILDVLHYLDAEAQVAVLRRVRAALSPGGMLLLRIGDAGAGLRFRLSHCVDRAVWWLRGHGRTRLHCRPLAAWLALLSELGFHTTAMPMSDHTPFANVLLVARAR